MEEDATEGYITTPKVHTNDLLKTLEGVEEYIWTFHGLNIAPLLYAAEADDLSNGHNTIDEEMTENSPILVAVIVGTTAYLVCAQKIRFPGFKVITEWLKYDNNPKYWVFGTIEYLGFS